MGLTWLTGHLSAPADLLDVGAVGGAFVAEAGSSGYRAWGIEPTPSFAVHARESLGVDVRSERLEDAALDHYSLDIVTIWHVLEHLPDPVGELTRLFRALPPGGIVAIEVPNYASAVARHQGTAWMSLEPDVHVSQFTPASMGEALRRAGFDAVEVFSIPITPYLSPVQRLAPGHVAARLKATRWLGTPRGMHPSGHELLRAIGAVPTHAERQP